MKLTDRDACPIRVSDKVFLYRHGKRVGFGWVLYIADDGDAEVWLCEGSSRKGCRVGEVSPETLEVRSAMGPSYYEDD